MRLKCTTIAAIIMIVLTLFIKAFCAEKCKHPTRFDFYQSVRILPVEITSQDKDTLYWKFEDNHGVQLGSFVVVKETKLPDKLEGTFFALYCEKHHVLYSLDKFPK